MKLVLTLLLALLAGSAFAHDRSAPEARHRPATATVALSDALHALSTGGSQCATHQAALLQAAAGSAVGPVYCRKMLACCDAGSDSCCDMFDYYCRHGGN